MRCIHIVCLLLLAAVSQSSAAATLAEKIESGDLRVNVSISPNDNIITKQEVSFYIDISTSTFFGGSTKIELPELEQVVIVKRDAFATAGHFLDDGKSFTLQRHELSLFPQVAGDIRVPPINLTVTVRDEGIDNISGVVQTPVLTFAAITPTGLPDGQWFAASDYQVVRELEPEDFTAQPGDSLTITVTQTAERLLPMMLEPYPQPVMEGVGVYPEAPQLRKQQERGAKTAIRVDKYVLVVEESGEFTIPNKSFFWFDTESQEFKEEKLMGLLLKTGEEIAEADIEPPPPAEPAIEEAEQAEETIDYRLLGWIVLLLVLLVWLYKVHKKSKSRAKASKPEYTRSQILLKITAAAKSKDWQTCARWFYYWIDRHKRDSSDYTARGYARSMNNSKMVHNVDQVLTAAYSEQAVSPEIESRDISDLREGIVHRFKRWRDRNKKEIKIQLDP